jgi:hypothetical protein
MRLIVKNERFILATIAPISAACELLRITELCKSEFFNTGNNFHSIFVASQSLHQHNIMVLASALQLRKTQSLEIMTV